MPEQTTEQLITDIHARVTAMDTSVKEGLSEDRIKKIIAGLLDTDKEFARKMRFGATEEPKLVGSKFARFGLVPADVEFLYDLQNSMRGQARREGGVWGGASEELTNAFKEISEASLHMTDEEMRQADKRAYDDDFRSGRVPKAFRTPSEYKRVMAAIGMRTSDSGAAGAMDTADSGYGSSLIGAQYVADLWAGARAESRVFNLLDTFEMSAPVAYLPVDAALPEMFFLAENTIRDPSDYAPVKTGSNRVTVTAYKFGIPQIWSSEMEEDSILPFIPYLRRQAQLSIAFYLDSLVLNGDTTASGGINNSGNLTGTGNHTLALDGIRHVGLVDNTGNQKSAGGALTFAMLAAARGRMVDETYQMDWGHPTNPTDLVYLADPASADSIGQFDEVVAWNVANGRPLITGAVSDVLGSPVIPTMALKKSLATGYVHASTGNDYGTVVTMNRRGFKVGWRRRISIATLFKPGTDQTQILYSLRLGLGRFSPTGAASGIEAADVIFYITLPS